MFIFVRTLSYCSVNEGESNSWRKIDDRNRIFSSLSFSKPKVPAVLPLANSLSENNTSTQAMAVVDIWEPNATIASTFFCSFDALAFEHTLVTFHRLIKVKKKGSIFCGTTSNYRYCFICYERSDVNMEKRAYHDVPTNGNTFA